jgi:hypothetical protein
MEFFFQAAEQENQEAHTRPPHKGWRGTYRIESSRVTGRATLRVAEYSDSLDRPPSRPLPEVEFTIEVKGL